MTIRPAKVSDIPRILDIVEAAQKLSSSAGVCDIDHAYARTVFLKAIRFHGGHGEGASLFLVSEADEKVQGYFVGVLDRMNQIGTNLTASDVHFYLPPDANESDVARIIDTFAEWANGSSRVVKMRMGELNGVGEPDDRFAALLERKGFTASGSDFTKVITR